jgi:hypothetical protein
MGAALLDTDLLTTGGAHGIGAESDVDTPPKKNALAGNDTQQEANQFAGMGPLLEQADQATVVRQIVEMIHQQRNSRKRRRAEWECNKLWVRGIRGARVRRLSEDRDDVQLVVPLGSYDLPPVMDRCEELIDKAINRLYADPPAPDAEPASDSDTDRDAAEFMTRLLIVEGAESGFNNVGVQRRAEKKAAVHGSGFVYVCVDPMGNGWRPTEIRALPTAMTEQDATIDPATQQPVTDTDERLETRYVTDGGQLTNNPSEARRQWLPKIKLEVFTGEHVILLPETCTGIDDAYGFILLRYTSIGKLRATFPDTVGKASQETLEKLVNWNPEDAKYARPPFASAKDIGKSGTDGKISDSALACTASLYFESYGDYPKGAYIVAAGEDLVLHKQTWCGMVETGPGEVTEECLELPLAQFRQLNDEVDDDHMGKGIAAKLGPPDEVRGNIVLGWEEYLDQFLHRNTFLPLGSIIQPGVLNVRDGTPILFNPGGKPEQETLEQFPPDAKEFYDRVGTAQEQSIGLGETAQGLESPDAQSGVAKQIVVQEAHVNFGHLRQNAGDGQERLWRIVGQHYRVFYTIPQKLKYQGDDGAYKEREWSRIDLGSTRDIRIARGSFTQQSPEAKQAKLDARYAAKLIDPEEYDRLTAVNIQATIGYQDNPHLTRWKEGPPDNWQPPQAPVMPDPASAQPVPAVDPNTGQPVPPLPDPANPFADVRAVDAEQDVARIRWLALRRELSSTAYTKQPAPWAKYLVDAYNVARQAAGIVTVAEQQQAAQQQQAAAANQAAQQRTQEATTKAQELGAKAHESEADRAFAAEQEQAKHRMTLERDAQNAQGAAVAGSRAAPTLAPTGAFSP